MLKYRILDKEDILNKRSDLFRCYEDNKLILDCQSTISVDNKNKLANFIIPFAEAEDSMVVGIMDNKEQFLFGIVIFDNIRIADTSCAEVHIAISKEIWGKLCRNVFTEMLRYCSIDILYCQIPKIAVRAIGMCKKLGFKKTGYIPKALPYTNSKGECKMYDINFYTYQRGI